jgi:two-component sensor histidine kinase
MPAGLLVNELLTNAFKYAFVGRERGTVALECVRDEDNRFRVSFADDGAGLPPGVTWPMPGKLGALILQTLRENTQDLEFAVASTPGGGTRITLAFTHKPVTRRPN